MVCDPLCGKLLFLIADSIHILSTISNMILLVEKADEQKAQADNIAIAQGLVNLEKTTGYRFTTDRPIKSQLFILYDQVSRLYDEEESDEMTVFPIYFKSGYSVKKELLSESILMPYENIMISAPKEYDVILKQVYRDYMVPRRVRAAHDYPFYREQIEILMDYLETLVEDKKNPAGDFGKIVSGSEDDRKIVLFHISAVELICNGGYALAKLKYIFDTIRNTPEILWWWYPCIIDKPGAASVHEMSPELFGEYCRMVEMFKKEKMGVYDESGNIQRAVSAADGYYGDAGELMELFKATGKPIMLLNYEIVE